MKNLRFSLYAIVCITACLTAACSYSGSTPDIIPVPENVRMKSGAFSLDRDLVVSYLSEDLAQAAGYLAAELSGMSGQDAALLSGGNGDIVLRVTDAVPDGAYGLDITGKGITITGNGTDGVCNGIATLRQLMCIASLSSGGGAMTVPCCSVEDAPEFGWRGIMLDVARHFFTVEEVKDLLDAMSFYKLNRLHWHLTDDQGWRVEIKKYPLLTEKGAWRHFNNHDRMCQSLEKSTATSSFRIPEERLAVSGRDTLYGGFYTQEEIREIVDYASARGIEIVPEVDMPGHMLAAIANYPWLACGDDLGWGELFSCPICPGKDSVLDFCKDIYSEIFSLFPSEYVHIGGDEVDQSNWETCPACRARMKEHGLESTSALQSWFTHEMEAFFNQHGKKLICWDEGIAGGLSETATVMWWRSWSPDPVAEAASEGTPVIACPNATFYLDYAQDSKSMGNIYRFDEEMASMFGEHSGSVIGVQGNLWTEKVPSAARMQHMIFPRLLALAELGWSSPEVKSFDGFNARLSTHFALMDRMDIDYRIPDLEGFYDVNSFVDSAVLEINCQDTSARIFYTTDGSIPDMGSAEYGGPVPVTATTDFTLRTFGSDGRQGEVVSTQFRKESYSSPHAAVDAEPGLLAQWHDYAGNLCSEIETAKLKGKYMVEDVSIPEAAAGNIGLIICGYFDAPETGIYTFRLFSDDGSVLRVDGETVIDNDGAHSPYEKTGQKALGKGLHSVEVRYFDHNGGLLEMKVLDRNGNVLSPEEIWVVETE